MKILFFFGHPGHVHHFKNSINELQQLGHDILVLCKNEKIIIELTDHYNFKYLKMEGVAEGFINKSKKVLYDAKNIYKAMSSFKPNLVLGRAYPPLSHVCRLLSVPYICFSDTDHGKIAFNLTIPFVRQLITPTSFSHDFGLKHKRVDTFFELAYLNPSNFKTRTKIRDKLGIGKEENLFVLRFAKYNSYHDSKSSGFKESSKTFLCNFLSKYGKVVIVSESKLPKILEKYNYDIKPYDFHSLLFSANLCITDGSTTAVESSILGTPTIHYEKIVNHGIVKDASEIIGYLGEIKKKYKMFETFSEESEVFLEIKKQLKDGTIKRRNIDKSNKLFKDKIDLNKYTINLVKSYEK